MALPKHVRFSEAAPLVHTFTPPATPRTPSPSSLAARISNERDDEYEYDEDDSGSEDSGPSTPPSTHRVLPAVAGHGVGNGVGNGVGSGYESALLLANSQNSPKKKAPSVVSVNPILYDAHTQTSQLVWDVSTLPVEHAYLVPSSSSSSSSPSPSSSASSSPYSAASGSASSTPSGRAASLKGFIKSMHMGKGSKDAGNASNDRNNNANHPHSHTNETVRRGNGKLGPSDRSLPATNPGLTSLDIHIPQLPPFWKPIQLRRSSSNSTTHTPTNGHLNSKPFAVGEILDAIHRYLQQPITSKEYKTLPEGLQKVIARSYWTRYDAALLRTPGNKEEAEKVQKGGVRRVDALGGCTMFVALVPAPGANGIGETWQVILAAPPASPSTAPAQRSS